MKTNLRPRNQQGGYALLLVMVFLGLSVLLLAGTMSWTSESTRLTDRNNEYFTTAAAAEAATEKVLVQLERDYIHFGDGVVYKNLGSYGNVIPTTSDDSYWGSYSFVNPLTGSAGTYVDRLSTPAVATLDGQYSGLNGYKSTYRITSNASYNNSRYGIVAGVRQDIAVEAIPLFQFAIFYTMDLEINPSPTMNVTGRVHSNGDIYTQPSSTLTFSNDVTSSGQIYATSMPTDPSNRGISNPSVVYKGEHDSGTSSLNLPIGTSNTPDSVFEVLKTPPPGEDPLSAIGTNRFYNKADVIILVSNDTAYVTGGISEQTTRIPTNEWSTFLTTTNSFYNARESSTVHSVDVDVAKLGTWISSSSNTVTAKLSGKTAPNIVYVADFRTSAGEPGVRLLNGEQLPATGLTVATPDPIYVQGNYNTKDANHDSKNSNNTTYTAPAAIIGDAITVLSGNWADANSRNSLSGGTRNANDTTVNAAFLGGIVPTTSASYSGGVENFPRFLENWSGKNFWYNGSMVVMFNSRTAIAPWGTGTPYYNPPNRNWAFDKNFYDVAKLPPGTPQILYVERVGWTLQTAGTP